MQVQALTRKFHFNSLKLDDPNPAWTPDQVKAFFATTYPDLTNAEIAGPEINGNNAIYTLRRQVGTKG
jgi:PRTRC genetic system protein C